MSHVRTTVTLCVLVAVFVAGSVIGFQLLTAKAPSLDGAGDEATCEPRTIQSGAQLGAGQITVNVYNASNNSGLAHRTLNALEKRGFRPGAIGNADEDVKVRKVAIMAKDPRSAPVRLVKKALKGKVDLRKPSDDMESGVSIVLGRNFKGVKKKSPKHITAKKATKVCVQIDPALK